MENNILEFRQAVKNLPEEIRERELIRALNYVKHIPVIALDDEDIGKVIKFLDVDSVVQYFKEQKGYIITKHAVSMTLKNNTLCHGYKIYYLYEEI